ncbi:MAG: radical SAM protein [Elusimicrobia bacterium]|nr:radical SAM protein [Elusimicrobiota bacterium]
MLAPPEEMTFRLTSRCNYRCLYCGSWLGGPEPDRLGAAAWKGLISQLVAWRGPGWRLHLTGGEPMLSPAFHEICAHAAGLGVYAFATTNASRISRAALPRLLGCGIKRLWISLDGMAPATHDLSRGRPGSYARARQALALLLGAAPSVRPTLGIAAIVMEHNLDELLELAEWCAGLGLEFLLHPLVRCGPDWRKLWPRSSERAALVLERLAALKARGCPMANSTAQLRLFRRYYQDPESRFPEAVCRTGRSLRIHPDGTCYLCDFGREPIGDAGKIPLDRLWSGAAARARRGEIRRCHRPCVLNQCNWGGAGMSSSDTMRSASSGG